MHIQYFSVTDSTAVSSGLCWCVILKTSTGKVSAYILTDIDGIDTKIITLLFTLSTDLVLISFMEELFSFYNNAPAKEGISHGQEASLLNSLR